MSARRPKPDEGLAVLLAFHQENARMYENAGAPYWAGREDYYARQVLKRMRGGENADTADEEGTQAGSEGGSADAGRRA